MQPAYHLVAAVHITLHRDHYKTETFQWKNYMLDINLIKAQFFISESRKNSSLPERNRKGQFWVLVEPSFAKALAMRVL